MTYPTHKGHPHGRHLVLVYEVSVGYVLDKPVLGKEHIVLVDMLKLVNIYVSVFMTVKYSAISSFFIPAHLPTAVMSSTM